MLWLYQAGEMEADSDAIVEEEEVEMGAEGELAEREKELGSGEGVG